MNSSENIPETDWSWVTCWSCGQKLCKLHGKATYILKVNKGKRFSFDVTIFAGTIRCNRCKEVTHIPRVSNIPLVRRQEPKEALEARLEA